MTPRVSIVLHIPGSASDCASVAPVILRQCQGAVELLLCGIDADRTDVPHELTRDTRVRFVPRAPEQHRAGVLNTALQSATGVWIAFADVERLWDDDHLERHLDTLQVSGRRLHLEVRGMATTSAPLDLAALCVENTVITSGVICERSLLGERGLFDESLPANAEWDLWLRLARVAQPAVTVTTAGHASEGAESLDALLMQLLTSLRVHLRTRDLAQELPGTVRRQWDARRILASRVDARLQRQPTGETRPAGTLIDIANAALRLANHRDAELANRLIERMLSVGSGDERLRRVHLRLLRALGRPEDVMLSLGEMQDTSHRDVLAELSWALRQLGQLADAEAVEVMLGGATAPPSTPPDVSYIPARSGTSITPTTWPSWLPRGTADAATWVRAAHAYLVAGLPAAASAAMQRAVDAGHRPDPEDQVVRSQVELDRALAAALDEAASPLTPVRTAGDTPRPVFMALDPEQLEPGPFHAVLADEVLGTSRHALARRVLTALVLPGTTYVDLQVAQEATPMAVLASLATPTPCIVLRADEPAVRRFQAGIAAHPSGPSTLVTASGDELLDAVTTGRGPVVLHVSVTQAASELLVEALARVAAAQRAVQILWSDTDVPSVGHHAVWPVVQELTDALGLHTRTLSERHGVIRHGSLHDDPRPQLLHTC